MAILKVNYSEFISDIETSTYSTRSQSSMSGNKKVISKM